MVTDIKLLNWNYALVGKILAKKKSMFYEKSNVENLNYVLLMTI